MKFLLTCIDKCFDYKPFYVFSRVILVVLWSVRRMESGLWLVLCPGEAAPAQPAHLVCTPVSPNSVPGLTRPLLQTKAQMFTVVLGHNSHQ